MKTEIINIVTFTCMVVVLGTQALLRGSWRVVQTEPVESDLYNKR